jgi:alkylhydroperoxidase family enzyme
MLDFTLKLTKTLHDITNSNPQVLRDTEFSDPDIFDITDVIGFYNYTNRLAHGLDIMPNPEYHAMNY